ncbi:MAG: hypothetical protein PHF86_10300 [Candidatus Nanoarchaeia archaeon]|nr:hypothetical protein [Candidatus Nanoarchaeia archaeon]
MNYNNKYLITRFDPQTKREYKMYLKLSQIIEHPYFIKLAEIAEILLKETKFDYDKYKKKKR